LQKGEFACVLYNKAMKNPYITKFIWTIRLFFKNILAHKQRGFTYVAIGDSTVEGIGATNPTRSYTGLVYASLRQHHKNTRYSNFGKAGAPIREVIENQLTPAIQQHPDLVTISVGANDIRLHTKLSNFERDLNHLITKLQEQTSAQIIINNIPDFSLTKAIPRHLKPIAKHLIHRFNAVIYKTAENKGIIHIDLHSQSKIYAKNYPEAIAQDNFHPSDFGYAIWANTIITHLQHILFKKTKAPTPSRPI
jgi:lysophospholipase L1-like esterase